MAGISKITLVGNLLGEPRSAQTGTGIPVTRFQVGVEREARGQNQGQSDPVMDIYAVSAFGQGGGDLEQRFRNGEIQVGSRLLVMGRLELREWSDQQGSQSSLDVTADDVFDLGPDNGGMIHSLLGANAPVRVVVAGNMGGDPEVRQVPSGKTVVNFSIAVSRPVPRNAQQRDENTNWYRIAGWANIADRMQKLADMGALSKGRKLLVEGTFTPRKWTDNNGQERVSLDLMARDFELLQGGDQQGGDGERFGNQRGGNDQYGGRSGGGNAGSNRGGYQDDPFGDRGGRGGGRQDENFGDQGDRSGRGGRQGGFTGGEDVDDIPF
jgi:single-strand DNA-binding protein